MRSGQHGPKSRANSIDLRFIATRRKLLRFFWRIRQRCLISFIGKWRLSQKQERGWWLGSGGVANEWNTPRRMKRECRHCYASQMNGTRTALKWQQSHQPAANGNWTNYECWALTIPETTVWPSHTKLTYKVTFVTKAANT